MRIYGVASLVQVGILVMAERPRAATSPGECHTDAAVRSGPTSTRLERWGIAMPLNGERASRGPEFGQDGGESSDDPVLSWWSAVCVRFVVGAVVEAPRRRYGVLGA